LGKERYDYMVASLTDVPFSDVWDSCKSYSVDETVIREGCTFVSLINDNFSDPLDSEDWNLFERFTTAGSNLLWTRYLRVILAYKVYLSSLFANTWMPGSGGVVVNQGDQTGFRSGKKDEIIQLKSEAMSNVERMTANMLKWLKDFGVENSIPEPDICGTACATPGRRQRRWAFRNEWNYSTKY